MIPHDHIAEQLPATADDRVLEAVDQAPPIRIIAHDLLSRVAPRHDVVDGTLEFDPQSAWHVARLNGGQNHSQAQKQKTKSVTAKPLSQAQKQKTKSVTAKPLVTAKPPPSEIDNTLQSAHSRYRHQSDRPQLQTILAL